MKQIILKYKQKIYNKKVEDLLKKNNIYDSISQKCNMIFPKSDIKDMNFNDLELQVNDYNVEVVKEIIVEFITNSLFSIIKGTPKYLPDKYLKFIIENNIYNLFFENLNIFEEEIKLLSQYKKILNKL